MKYGARGLRRVQRIVVPCRLPAWPASQPLFDLTRDGDAAHGLFATVQPFFRFKAGEARFSGYAGKLRPDHDPFDPCFYVQIWNGERVYRTVAFKGLGYWGILHVDLLRPDRAIRIKDDDPVSMVWNGLDNWTNLDLPFLKGQIWYVEGDTLKVDIPWHKLKANRPRWVLDGRDD
jgi:hypothetical protein